MREQQRYAAPGTGRSDEPVHTRRRVGSGTRLAAVVAVGLAAAMLSGCGKEGAEDPSAPKKVAGEAAPAPGDSPGDKAKKGSDSPSSSSRERDGKAKDDKAPPASSGDKEQGSSGGSSGASGSSGGAGGSDPGTPNSGSCKTSELGFSTSNGMAEGSLLVNLKNTGSATCTLKGYPGADLRGEGGSLNAERRSDTTPLVSLTPGESTRFTLNYPPNDSGGSGVTMTSLVVTPPNETQSQTLPVSVNLPVSDSTTSGITVGPVGTGK
ncbi:DUF4232 domain-containing protein [Streptomyces iconiensis]|uniref:DUF4232 domain-containing protein n=1 Tax=Streptomyces iconiensis TaxID=1384038 RepID=A0ABT6ZRL9_9ACTN|nr:DUF4232 domain-containing protein [Streptomyces iconiensis]MDJ1131502.1 DUF4232 domain-containing protein [Streptomyces iconiensis]